MKNPIDVREAKVEDLPEVYRLICELAIFEKAEGEVEVSLEQLRHDAFGLDAIVEILVAENEDGVVGAALFYEKYSTWKGRAVHLEDLVVSEQHRGRGIGSALFEALMSLSAKRGYSRMDWQVLDWNESAIAFYEKYKAEISKEWLNGRFTASQLQDWARREG